MPHFMPTDVRQLLDLLLVEPGRPRLTWYGPGGERIELSGHVLVNWATKTTNLLVEELDAGPGTRVLIDLPPHWRTVVWALGTWQAGACVVPAGPADEPEPAVDTARSAAVAALVPCDVVVTHRPDDHPGAGRPAVVAVELPALARRWEGALPPGALDAASAVMTYGDRLGWVPDPDPAGPAVAGPVDVAHHELLTWAATSGEPLLHTAGRTAPARALVEPADQRIEVLLAAVLTILAADGSVVLLDPVVTRELAADPRRRATLTDGERVTG